MLVKISFKIAFANNTLGQQAGLYFNRVNNNKTKEENNEQGYQKKVHLPTGKCPYSNNAIGFLDKHCSFYDKEVL